MNTVVRAGVALLALAFAAAVGAVTTFAHAASPPWLLIAGLVLVTAFVLGIRLTLASPLATGAAVLGIAGAALLIALLPGDEIVVVAADPLGVVWLAGATLLPIAATLWPLSGRKGNTSESP